jgi:hypothetical protein
MPTKVTERMIAAAIAGFEEQKRQIDAEIAELRGVGKESGLATAEPATEMAKPPRRKISAASRKKMALAQQKRWAAKRGESVPETPKAPVAKKARRKMSAATKANMIAAIKKRWAEKRAAAKKTA